MTSEQEAAIEARLVRIEDLLGDLREVMAVNTSSLKEHMRRTELLEEAVKETYQALKPLQAHVSTVNSALKVAGWSGGLLGTVASLAKIIDFLKIWRH